MSGPLRLAARMARIRPFYVMDLLARARALEAEGRSIIHLEIGEPDFTTPEPIIDAGHRALAAGETHYTPALGLPALRAAIAGHYAARFGVALDPRRVVVTPGSSGALQLVLSALVDPGEQVLMADPGYPCNRHFVVLAGGEPVGIPVGVDSGYQLDADRVAAHWQDGTRAVLAATPSNPTGTLIPPAALTRLAETVRARDGALIVDEIYQGLTYGAGDTTVLARADDALVINSFSKFFGMTGWRVGWAVVPEPLVEALDRLAQNIFLAAPTLAQHAALAAFEPAAQEILEQRRQLFAARRDFLLPELEALGFRIRCRAQGAFYLYAECDALTDDSFAFAQELLERAGVAITPGRDFGDNAPERHVRFAYTRDIPVLEEGVARLRRFLAAGG